MSKIEVNTVDAQCGSTITIGSAGKTVNVPGTALTSTLVKSDDYQAADGGNIVSQCGTDITLGASGDTINLASGASQSGFGRTGTVDWVTTPQTGTVTAATGKGYFVNTTAGEITVNLPAGAAGSIVAVADYANTADTNTIIITPNGAEKIQGTASSFEINVEGGSVTLVYVDSTQGWRPTDASTASAISEQSVFIAATGGNQPTASGCIVCTNYKVHKFTGPGTFCISAGAGPAAFVDYLVLAGGGSGGLGDNGAAGGGGAGGFRESHSVPVSGSYTASPLATCTSLPISPGPYSIVVGGGGGATPTPASPNIGNDGSLSSFSSISSAGGGAGGGCEANDGGSGGGGGAGGPQAGGSGNVPSVTPNQGKDGGNGGPGSYSGDSGGGGGGATSCGTAGQGTSNPGGPGGNGGASEITASPITYGGGGGGGVRAGDGQPPGRTVGAGGPGGGGPGGRGGPSVVNAGTGTVNLGAGGGGGGYNPASGPNTIGAAGGSGIVVIRYKFQ